MNRRRCPHLVQYIDAGRPLPCADPGCPGGKEAQGEMLYAVRDRMFVPTGVVFRSLWFEETAFDRVIDDGVYVWRQERPWS